MLCGMININKQNECFLFASFSKSARMSDNEIKTAIRQAFIAVEKGFFQSLDDALAEKTELQLQMPEVSALDQQ